MSEESYNISFLGLYNAGKSSFLRTLNNLPKNQQLVGKTKGPNKMELEILGFKIYLFDFGGFREHRDNFIEKKANYINSDLIFYVIDTQDNQKFGDSVEFFSNLLKELEKNEVKPKIVVCFHKSDPELIEDKFSYIYENLKFINSLFRNRSKGWDITYLQTSIYKYSSLVRAYIKGLIKIFVDPPIIMNTIFKQFMDKTNFDGICLFDQDGLILFELYNQTPHARKIIEVIGLNMAQMSEKLISYNVGFPNSIQVDMKGQTFFRNFELENGTRYYLTIYSRDINNFEKINKSLPYFTETISNAMEDILIMISSK